jgi:hypothetical protein
MTEWSVVPDSRSADESEAGGAVAMVSTSLRAARTWRRECRFCTWTSVGGDRFAGEIDDRRRR